MNNKVTKSRGATSVMAVLFVSLFGTLSVSFFYVTNMNVQMARNHRDVACAYAMSESGLEYAQCLFTRYLADEAPYTYSDTLTPEEKRTVFTDFTIYAAEYLYGSTILGSKIIYDIQTFSDGGDSGRQFILPAILAQASGSGQFTLRFRQYDNELDIIEITSTGTCGTLSRTVQLDFAMSIDPPSQFDFAIFGRDSLSLSNGVTVDGYNFDPEDDPLAIGSLSIDAAAITLNNSSTVDGNVEVAPGGDPDSVVYCNSGAMITGDVNVQEEEWPMPVVEVPAALESSFSQGSISGSGTIVVDGKYESINLGKNDVLTIDGDVALYVTGDINMGQTARIEVNTANPNARLTLYMGGNLLGEKNASITNPSTDATRIVILGLDSCNRFELDNSGLIHAAIYTPYADVIFHNAVELYGAVVGRSFLQNNGTDMHYDANLRDLKLEGVSCDINVSTQPNSYTEIVFSLVKN